MDKNTPVEELAPNTRLDEWNGPDDPVKKD